MRSCFSRIIPSSPRCAQKRPSCGSDRSRGRRSSATAAMAPYPPRRSYRDFVPSLIVSSPKLVSRRFALSKFFATEICPKRNTVRRVTPRQQSLGHFWQRRVIYDRSSRCLSPNATTGRSIEYDAVTNPYSSRRSDHGVHPSARELPKIGDLLPIVANECPQNFAILG